MLLYTTLMGSPQKRMVKLILFTCYRRGSEPGYESLNFSAKNMAFRRDSHLSTCSLKLPWIINVACCSSAPKSGAIKLMLQEKFTWKVMQRGELYLLFDPTRLAGSPWSTSASLSRCSPRAAPFTGPAHASAGRFIASFGRGGTSKMTSRSKQNLIGCYMDE